MSAIPAVVVGGAFLAGCGAQDTTGKAGAGAEGGAGDGKAQPAGGYPLMAKAISTATSLTWELREEKKGHPLETAESIKATVCLYTAADAPQQGSDPLALRADVVTGASTATKLTPDFEKILAVVS